MSLQAGLLQFTVERAFYGAMKLHLYATVSGSVLEPVGSGAHAPLHQYHLGIHVGRFTSRKVAYLFLQEGGARMSSEFLGFTSHKVREMLQALEEAGVVEAVGRGLRDAQTYRWREPIQKYEMCSFQRVHAAARDDSTLGLEALRILEGFQERPFAIQDLVRHYHGVHRASFLATRWGKRRWDEISNSLSYVEHIRERLRMMHRNHLVDLDTATGRFQLNAKGRDVGHHMGLFLWGPRYVASYEGMCLACPLHDLCHVLCATDLLVKLVNGEPVYAHSMNGDLPESSSSPAA